MAFLCRCIFRLFLVLPLVLLPSSLFSQQIPVYSMQGLVSPAINPSCTGLDGIYSFVVLTRQQWVGFEGAPRSYYIAANIPLRNRHTGIGLDVQIQSSGPFVQTGYFLNYSYMVGISDNSSLSFGLRGGINSYNIDLNALRIIDPGDFLFETNVDDLILPNFGTGLHFIINNYFIDLSIPRLIRNEFSANKADKVRMQNREDRIYFICAGSEYPVAESFLLQPALSVWLIRGAPPLVDIRLSGVFQNTVGFGAIYRTSGLFGGNISYKISDNIVLGYAYELPLAYSYQINSGTHEVVLGFNIELLNKKTLSPRRF